MSPKELTCAETYSMQSSNFDNIGIKPSPFTDKTGEFSFCKVRERKLDSELIPNINNLSPDCLSGLNISVIWQSHHCLKSIPFTADLSRHTFWKKLPCRFWLFQSFKQQNNILRHLSKELQKSNISHSTEKNCGSWARMQLLISVIQIMS